MAGAGKSSALRILEDRGYFCIDSLPISFLNSYLAHEKWVRQKNFKLAIHLDSRDENFFKLFEKEITTIRKKFPFLKILYLTAQNEMIIRRFSETRRPHPLAKGKSLVKAIQDEKKKYEKVSSLADFILDTTHFNVHVLRQSLLQLFGQGQQKFLMTLSILSFGYRYGIPPQCDWVVDVRFLPNPYFVPAMKNLTGLNARVRNFVLKRKETKEFLLHFKKLLESLLPKYLEEGKSYLTIAFGCTGGKHRSVSLAEYFKTYFEKKKYSVHLDHRDVYKK